MLPSAAVRGSAFTDARFRTIMVKPSILKNPTRRFRLYVLTHEYGHAVHWEVLRYACDELMTSRRLDWRSALEVVAERFAYDSHRSAAMKGWIRTSIAWHRMKGYRYSWADVMSSEAGFVSLALRQAVATP